MKIYKYLWNKYLYGGGLKEMEKQVLACIIEENQEIKKELRNDLTEHLSKRIDLKQIVLEDSIKIIIT